MASAWATASPRSGWRARTRSMRWRPAEKLVSVPDGVTSIQAAAAMLQGMTAQYLASSTYPLKAGDTCLIHAAAGGVGQLFCQVAKMRGAFVIGTAGGQEHTSIAVQAGADEVIDYKAQDFEREVSRITGGKGVRVVYDSVGKTTFEKGLNCLERRGMMVLFGQSSGPVGPIDPQALEREGVPLPDAADSLPLRRAARGAGHPLRAGSRLGPRRAAQALDLPRIPAVRSRRGPPPPGVPPDLGQAPARFPRRRQSTVAAQSTVGSRLLRI